MAGSSVIGALRVNLGIDSAAFSAGLKNAQAGLSRFGSMAKTGLLAAGAAAATAGAALGLALKGALDEADEMSKLASKIGVPIEELSRLKYAADLSGVSIEGVGTSFKKLSTAMVEAQNGSKSQVELFDQLGVAFANADGSLRSSSDVLLDVADKFAGMEDGAMKTALAVELFGKSGLDMIPLLNGGAAGLKAMTDEARALGLTISAETGKAAEQFNDNLSRLQATFSGMVTQIAASLAPTLASVTDFLVELSTAFRDLSPQTQTFISVGGALTVALAALAIPLGLVAVGIAAIGLPVAAVIAGITALTAAVIAFWPEIQRAWEVFVKFNEVMIQVGSGMLDALVAKFTEITVKVGQFVVDFAAAFAALPGQMLTIGGQIIDGLWQGIQAKWEGLKANVTGLGNSIVGWFKSPLDINSPSRVMHEIGVNIMQGLGLGIESETAKVVGVATTASTGITTAMKGAETAVKQVGASSTNAFSGLGSSIAEAIKGTKEWSDVLSDVVGKFADMALQGLTASFGGGGGGIGGFLSSLVGGLFGFARGGTIMPGGTGGIDSQVVAFRKSPNERVDITKPGQTLNSGGGVADVRVYVDQNGNWQAEVERISEGTVSRAAPAILGQANRNVMPTVAHHQTAKAGGDYRNT